MLSSFSEQLVRMRDCRISSFVVCRRLTLTFHSQIQAVSHIPSQARLLAGTTTPVFYNPFYGRIQPPIIGGAIIGAPVDAYPVLQPRDR